MTLQGSEVLDLLCVNRSLFALRTSALRYIINYSFIHVYPPSSLFIPRSCERCGIVREKVFCQNFCLNPKFVMKSFSEV